MTVFTSTAIAATFLSLVAIGGAQAGIGAMSLEEAQTLADQRDKLILLEFGTEW
jgi:hypothetical protein